MFTGIIETLGEVISLQKDRENIHITIKSSLSKELRIDQSVAHNGVCLTVILVNDNEHTVTAVAETLQKTNLGLLNTGDMINLERSMMMNGRIDGHIVQGHIDTTGVCTKIDDQHGSWLFSFKFNIEVAEGITVGKGSVCVNGVSLTVVDSGKDTFSVAIIPYTFDHTNFGKIKPGDLVNIEFDILGKYVAKYLQLQN